MDLTTRKKVIKIIEKYLAMKFELGYIATCLNKFGYKTRERNLWTAKALKEFVRYHNVKPLDLTPQNEQLDLPVYPEIPNLPPPPIAINEAQVLKRYAADHNEMPMKQDGKITRELELVSAVLNSNIYDPLKKEIIGRITA
jgi:hypothetical protein